MTANPVRDQVAIVGIGTTPYVRSAEPNRTSAFGLAVDACAAAITDSGLARDEIDGVSGSGTHLVPVRMAEALGLPELHWWANHHSVPSSFGLGQAVNAVAAGACTAAVAFHAVYRDTLPRATRDPLRERNRDGLLAAPAEPEAMTRAVAFSAWANRYLHEYGAPRADLGLVAVNSRANARRNEHATMTAPLTLEEYLRAPMIRDPLCLLDMDVPVDGADAFVVTTAERASDLDHPAVLVHASTFGLTRQGASEESMPDLRNTAHDVAMRRLWQRSTLTRDDFDLIFAYDGFTIIALNWLEAAGLADRGGAGDFLRTNWNEKENRVLVRGRVPINAHGGNLSEGATQGSGAIREAVTQLRGSAPPSRQVSAAGSALLMIGGLFHNASALALRADR